MRLKVTLDRGVGRQSADLSITIDPKTTIGSVADYLARCDPETSSLETPQTIAIAGRTSTVLRPEGAVGGSALVSGTTIALTPADRQFTGASSDTAAVLHVVSGPDAGKEFGLPIGTSVIGRGRDSDIQLTDLMMSRRHAEIRVGEVFEIVDLGSSNGVLVGDVAEDAVAVHPGQPVQLGDSVIAIRRGPGHTTYTRSSESVEFNRPPQVQKRCDGQSFTVPDFPTKTRARRFPIIPLFAPMLMGAALYITTKSPTSLIFMAMSPLMMIGNVAEGQLAGKKTERVEREAFHDALARMRSELESASKEEVAERLKENPSVEDCAVAIRRRTPLLWSRRPELSGFGELRLGVGIQPSRSKVDRPFGRQGDPELVAEMQRLLEPFASVGPVPIACDLAGTATLGVAGAADRARNLARAYVLQLVALHSHTDLAVCAISGTGCTAEWDWLKWLPHCGEPGVALTTPLASSGADVARLLGEINALVRPTSDAARPSATEDGRRILIVIDDPSEVERSRIADLLEHDDSQRVWAVWVADSVNRLPAVCKAFVNVSDGGDSCVVGFVDQAVSIAEVSTEPLELSNAEDLARALSPVQDSGRRDDAQSDLPRSVSLLALVGRELAESPDSVIERWVESRSILMGPRALPSPGRSRLGNLRAVVGESAAGPHVLDLRVHGPHALVGGTTGSGKSELLQSWIIGMAVSNSPQRLTFLLVDYKGGSAFSECVHLPHTVGLVTDLSPHLVRRALTSLSAELRYRERILHRKHAKDLAALERDGDPEAPPSLVIVVDEFAALVKEVPEFVDGVVNVAQRGRSLGLHLILATQRPSGVIRDNLRANTNLRIALRMADAADSTDVIGTKAAANFDATLPGRAASRSGATALVPFQTGFVGGWTSEEPDRPEVVVSSWGFAATTTWEPKDAEPQDRPGDGPTDIQKLVACVSKACDAAEIQAPRRPWLPELAHLYDLAKLPSVRRDDELIFAVADDPANQQQSTIAFRPDEDGNMAVFGTGNSGKSTLLRTLAISAGITVRGGPVHVYGVDFAAQGLQMLEQLPHVGAVIPGSDTERVARLLTLLRRMIDERAHRYAEHRAASITQYRSITSESDEPRILVLIDGMGGMRTAYEGTEHHNLYERFLSIAGDGRRVGIHVVLAADRAGAVPSALASLIQRRVVLRLANDTDYTTLGEANDVLDAKSPPGRGLCNGLEIQVAILGENADLPAQDLAVRSLAQAMRNAGVLDAPPIQKLTDDIPLDELSVEADGGPAFAVAADSLEPRGLPQEGTFTVAGPPRSGRTTSLLTIAEAYRRWRPDTRLVLLGVRRSALADAIGWDHLSLGPDDAARLALEVPAILGEADGGATPPGVVIIENLVDFLQTSADPAMQDMIKQVVANGHVVVSDGEPVPLNGLQPLLQAARSSRVGIVLQPEQTDGMLFRTQFPRVRKADFPPGRALYVARSGQPAVVQVAKAGSPPR